MDAVLFGATGMIGQAVLRECLLDPGVGRVLSIGRSASGVSHPKLREVVRRDLLNVVRHPPVALLGHSRAGDAEAEETGVVAGEIEIAVVANSGSKTMWARVKGETEDALLRMPFRRAYMFRPAFIQPMHGETSRTRLYRVLYRLIAPFTPLLKRVFPRYVTTTEILARAMIRAARDGTPSAIVENDQINALLTPSASAS